MGGKLLQHKEVDMSEGFFCSSTMDIPGKVDTIISGRYAIWQANRQHLNYYNHCPRRDTSSNIFLSLWTFKCWDFPRQALPQGFCSPWLSTRCLTLMKTCSQFRPRTQSLMLSHFCLSPETHCSFEFCWEGFFAVPVNFLKLEMNFNSN